MADGGAYITLGLHNTQFAGLPFWLAVPLAVVLMGALGYLIEMFVLRRMFGQPQIAVVILTIALGFVLRFAAGLIWGHEPVALETPFAGQYVRFGGLSLGVDGVVIIAVTVILTALLYIFFNRTRVGVAMQAASQNQLAAYYMGIPVKRINSLVWAIAGAVAAIAGVLFASKGTIDPSIGLLGIKAFAAAVIGGFGSLPGALLGGLIIGVIEPFASRYIEPTYAPIMPYLLLFLILVFRPHGILAQVHAKKV